MVVGGSQLARPAVLGPSIDDVSVGFVEGVARIENFFRQDVAQSLLQFLALGLEYERVEYGDLTRQWRAQRPVGEEYFGSLVSRSGHQPDPVALEALAVFESEWFLSWVSKLVDVDVCFLRPPTPYRLDPGDRVCLHDDMSDPSHAVSVALNLTPHWRTGDGGETRVGWVTGKRPVPTPADCPIDLHQWEVAPGSQLLPPVFNSILVLRLGYEFAHAVEPVRGSQSRYSVTTIYGRALA
jgi:hypothetical protein